ncbi:unnamed protein product [Adineta steineri]|uniref:Uncharacterized protein n=2 Tax=Adineta steineri TaxID=433720 RepID=A0A819KQC6_9BILA|nr:unnamed protein product [Adineta steineri]
MVRILTVYGFKDSVIGPFTDYFRGPGRDMIMICTFVGGSVPILKMDDETLFQTLMNNLHIYLKSIHLNELMGEKQQSVNLNATLNDVNEKLSIMCNIAKTKTNDHNATKISKFDNNVDEKISMMNTKYG